MYFAGIFFPLHNLGWLGSALERLPLSVHVEIFRAALGQGPSAPVLTLFLTAAYAVLGIGVAAYAFRRRIGRG
jgi:ABC-2 type transport system permease protein